MNLLKTLTFSVLFGLSSLSAVASPNLIVNGDFAGSNVPFGSYYYGNGFTSTVVTDAPWAFTNGSGIANNSSAWGGEASTGTVAFIQSYVGFSGAPTISQTFTSASSEFSISFDVAQRTGYGAIESLNVTIDGQSVVANLTPGSGTLSPYSFNISGLTGSSHSLMFTGVNGTRAEDASLFLDNVNVTAVPEPETYGMMLIGLGLIGFSARRRKNKQA